MDLLDRLLEHDHWATACLLDLSRDLTDAQLDRPFDIGHRTLRDTFDHLIFNIAFWTGLMSGQPVSPDRSDRSMPALIERYDRYHATFATAARQAQDEGRLEATFVDQFDYPQSQGATIIHVLWHNTQHRSEARHILERLGVPDLWDLDPQEWEHVTQGG